MKVACYARVSSERQAEKDLSIPAQLKALKRYALERGWEVASEYVDEAESARTANRPKFKEMVAAARRKSKPFEAILVWKLSRFARNREDSIIYKSLLRKQGVQVISINEPVDESAAGKLLEGMIEVIDEWYSANLAVETVKGQRENALRGYSNGGIPPYGYRAVKVSDGRGNEKTRWAPDPEQGPLVADIFGMYAKGGVGLFAIAQELNARGVPAARGRLWSKTSLHSILRNEAYLGRRIWNREDNQTAGRKYKPREQWVVVDGAHEPLVSQDLFDAVQAKLQQRRTDPALHPRAANSDYLLTGLVRCGQCQAHYCGFSTGRKGTKQYYACTTYRGKGKDICPAPLLEKLVFEDLVLSAVRDRVLTEENVRELTRLTNERLAQEAPALKAERARLDRELKLAEEKLARLQGALASGELGLRHLAEPIKDLTQQREGLRSAIAEVESRAAGRGRRQIREAQVIQLTRDLRDLLLRADRQKTKTFLRCIVDSVVVGDDSIEISYSFPADNGNGDDPKAQDVIAWRQRRGWDSNPRGLAPQRFSRPSPSTARTPLRERQGSDHSSQAQARQAYRRMLISTLPMILTSVATIGCIFRLAGSR